MHRGRRDCATTSAAGSRRGTRSAESRQPDAGGTLSRGGRQLLCQRNRASNQGDRRLSLSVAPAPVLCHSQRRAAQLRPGATPRVVTRGCRCRCCRTACAFEATAAATTPRSPPRARPRNAVAVARPSSAPASDSRAANATDATSPSTTAAHHGALIGGASKSHRVQAFGHPVRGQRMQQMPACVAVAVDQRDARVGVETECVRQRANEADIPVRNRGEQREIAIEVRGLHVVRQRRFAAGQVREFVCNSSGHVGAYARQVAVGASAEPARGEQSGSFSRSIRRSGCRRNSVR